MSSVSSNVESIAGHSVITDPYLYVAWSNATHEERDNGDWKKSIKAPMRAGQKKPPQRQLSQSLASDESSKPSSKPSSSSSSSSTHMDAVQRRPTPPRLMSTVSSNVESIAGPPIITDPYLYVAWSKATREEQDNGDWKKSAKAPMRADKKEPPRRQLSRAPESAQAPIHPDSDASDKSSDEEDKMVLSKKSCKPPLGASLPPSPDDDDDSEDGDGDEISTTWRFPSTGSQRIMAMPAGEGVSEQLLEDSASDTLNNNLLVPHPVVEVVDKTGSRTERVVSVKATNTLKAKVSKVPKIKVPKPPKEKKKKKLTLKTGVVRTNVGFELSVQLAQTNAPLRLLLDHESMKETAQQSFKAFIHAFDDNDNPAKIELDSEGEEDMTTEEDSDRRKPPHNDSSPGYSTIPSTARMCFDTGQQMNPVKSTSNTPEEVQNITWRRDTELPEHPQRSSFGATKIKPEAVSKFDTPVNSFLAFLPISIWETMVEYSNKKAHQKHWISGHPWTKDLCLEELMTFSVFSWRLHCIPHQDVNTLVCGRHSHCIHSQPVYP
eukprot:scaffold28086_cov32-Attheya_sp.AAC.1